MFVKRPWTENVFRAVVIAAMLFNSSAHLAGITRTALAQGEEPTATPTAEPSDTPTASLAPVPFSGGEDGAPTETATPIATDTSTTTGFDTVSATQQANATPTPTTTTVPSTTTDETSILSLFANPDFITPGGNLMLNWEVADISFTGNSYVLKITIPETFTLQGNFREEYDVSTRTMILPVNDLGGQVHLRYRGGPSDARFEAALLKGEEVIAQASLLIPFREQFVLEKRGGEILAMGGKIKIEFPEDALPEKAVIEVGTPRGEAVPKYSLLGKPFEIKAHMERSGKNLRQFSEELSITVSYADLGISEQHEGDLHLYWYNTETEEWVALPTIINRQAKTLTAFTDHFTVFDINFNHWQASHLPTVDSFQVSEFTGAGTYTLPIEVPPGPGGFQPNLALIYNSQIVDQSTLITQASWVGMGWSLETGSIELDAHGTTSGSWAVETHLLNVGGISTRIVKDPNGIYHAADENFWRITFTGSSWVIQDKQGNTYYFDKELSSPYGMDGQDCTTEWQRYRWLLTKVTNIFGQEIQYSYTEQTKIIPTFTWITSQNKCKRIDVPVTTAVYPSAIIYAGGKYRVRFDIGATQNRYDFTASWDTDYVFHSFQKHRLQNVYVEQDADGNGIYETILRRYQLSYAANTDTDIIFPGYTWTAGGKTTTLRSVREYGVGGTASLPATTFTYGDNLHLTRVVNGYGGEVNFNYELWYYPNDARDSYTVEVNFGRYDYPCYFDDPSPWYALSGEVSCGDGSRDPLHIWGSSGIALAGNIGNPAYSIYGANNSKDLIRPGGMYKITATIGWTSAITNVQVGLHDGVRMTMSNVSVNGSSSTYFIQLPKDAFAVMPAIQETGGSGLGNRNPEFAAVSYFKLQLLPSVYRVKTKQISDGNGHAYTYTYSYLNDAGADSAGVNDAALSPNGTCEREDTSCNEYIERFSEFRGHSKVTVTGPDGTKTITKFHQDDVLKGRPISIASHNGERLVGEEIFSYTSTSLPIAVYSPCGLCLPYRGLERYWIRTNSAEKRIYASDGVSYAATRTLYTYDSTYGNLLTETEQSLEGGVWATYRIKESEYYPNDSTGRYLVSLPARIRNLDAANNVLSSTLFLYDNNTGSYATPPVNGVLTATRTRTTFAADEWNQISYDYDAWGNRTRETTYSDYSTWSASPTTGARTTTTVYDPIFHVYPLSQTTPPTQNAPGGLTTVWKYDYNGDGLDDYILGVPTQEIDPNGNKTDAAYDPFGRLVRLIRPGDAITNPTISISYNDTGTLNAFPFTTTVTQKIDETQSFTIQRIYDGMGRQTRMISAGVITDTNYVSATETWQSLPYVSGEIISYTRTIANPPANTVTEIAPDGASTVKTANGLISTFRDANQNVTTTISDVWGRTTLVIPPIGPSVSYGYDQMNRLTTITRQSDPDHLVDSNPGANGLISWWSLDETSGARYDSHGSNDFTDNNTVTSASGITGNAADFAALNSEYLSVPENAELSAGDVDFTVCGWYYLKDKNDNYRLFAQWDAPTDNRSYQLIYSTVWDNFVMQVSPDGTINDLPAVVWGGANPSANQWYYVCAWHDAAGNKINIQVNNGVVSSLDYSSGVYDSNADITIGAGFTVTSTVYSNMRADEVLFYKRILTANERAWLYNNGYGRTYPELTAAPPSGSAQVTKIEYDSAGRKTKMEDPDMGVWTYEYDALGNLTRQTDARGCQVFMTYDALNRLATKTSSDAGCGTQVNTTYSYDAGTNGKGRRTSMTDASGSTAWLYDTRGRLIKETKTITGQTFITEYGYNSADLMTWMKYPDAEVVTYTYNNRMLLNSVVGASNYVTSTLYDSAGRITQRALGNGLAQTYEYYAWNETINSVGQGGRLKNITVGSLQNLNYLYDPAGNITQIIDAVAGETNLYNYDALHRLTNWNLISGTGGMTETYAYDPATGNLASKAGVTYTYDPNHAHAVSSLSNGNSYTYDANGNQTMRVIDGQTYTLAYDAENRLVSVSPGGMGYAPPLPLRGTSPKSVGFGGGQGGGQDHLISYNPGFDYAGAPLSAAQGQTSFPTASLLDTFNRANGSIGSNWSGYTSAFAIASDKLDVSGGGYDTYIFWKNNDTPFGADQEAYVTLSQVDADGSEHNLLLKSQSNDTYGDGVIEVLYDANSDLIQVWTFDPSSGWTLHGADIPVTFNNGDQFGARAKANGDVEVYKNGVLLATRDVSSWQYYNSGGYIGLWFAEATDALLDDFGGGNVTSGATATPQTPTVTASPTQTATQTSTPTATVTKTVTSTATATASPTATGTQIATQTPTNVPTSTFTATSLPTNTPTATSTQTAPATATKTATPTFTPTSTTTPTLTPSPTPTVPPFTGATFVYDGDGRRVAQTVNGVTTYFVGNYYEVVTSPQGTQVNKHYYAGGQRVAMRKNGTLYYMFSDHLGSTSLTTDSAGNVISELWYKPWGEVRYASGVTLTPYQYTGQYSDSYINLLWYGSRHYDPSLNRFTQPDSIVPDPYNSQDWDRYAYARNNPVLYTDPTGHLSEKEFCKYMGYCDRKLAEAALGKNVVNLLWGTEITWGDTIILGTDENSSVIHATLVLFANTDDNSLTGALWNIDTGERVQWSTASEAEYIAAYNQQNDAWYSSDKNGNEWCNRDICTTWAGGTPTTHTSEDLFLDKHYVGYGLSNYYVLDGKAYALAAYGTVSLLLDDPKPTIKLVIDLAALVFGGSDLAPKATYPMVSFVNPHNPPLVPYVPLAGFTSMP